MSLSFEGAWWEVDLGSDVLVKWVRVWNRLSCCQDRLAPVTLTLYDQYNTILWQYRVIGSTKIQRINFDISRGQVSIWDMNGSEKRVTITPKIFGRNFCVQDCTASGENDVNVRLFPIL